MTNEQLIQALQLILSNVQANNLTAAEHELQKLIIFYQSLGG